jgi:hypothetical protein
MDSKFDQILELLLRELMGQGERVLREKAYEGLLEVVKATRKIVLLQQLLTICCFLWSMSVFVSLFLISQQWGHFHWTPELEFCVSAVSITTLVLYFTAREKTWTRAFRTRERPESFRGISPEEVALIVDQVLDRKLAEIAARKSPPPSDSDRQAS